MSEPTISVDRLVKVYKTETAVDGISFTLARGSITALLGANGAGKTTTIATIMGLLTPTSGKVTVLGAEMPWQRHRVLHRMNFESPYVDMPMRLTIRQNLTVFGMLYGVVNLPERIAKLAEELELTELLDRPTGKLSSGQKTRVSLAKSLINEPEVLLLDEPTASLDSESERLVQDAIAHLCQGRTTIVIAHRLHTITHADRILVVENGTITESGRHEELLRKNGRYADFYRLQFKPQEQGDLGVALAPSK